MANRLKKMLVAALLMMGGALLFAGAAMRDDLILEDGSVHEPSTLQITGVAVLGALLALPLVVFYKPGGRSEARDRSSPKDDHGQ